MTYEEREKRVKVLRRRQATKTVETNPRYGFEVNQCAHKELAKIEQELATLGG